MSDTSQGEGWWQASDGRWYPPEQHPGAGSAPSPTAGSEPSTTHPQPSAAATAAGSRQAAATPEGTPVAGGPAAGGSGGTGPGAPAPQTAGGGGSRRGVLVVALVAVVALIAAAVAFLVLGDDDDDDDVASGGQTPAAADGDLDEFCAAMDDLGDDGGPFEDEAELEAFEALAPSAPPEIRDDMVLVADALRRVDAEIEQAEDDGDLDAVMEAAFGLMLDPEVLEASERLEQFLVEECGIEPVDGPGEIESPGEMAVMGVALSEVEARFEEIAASLGLDADYYLNRMGTDRLSQLLVTVSGGDGDDADDMLEVCDQLSAFLADHSDAEGTASIEVMRSMSSLQVVNDEVGVGDPGECTAGVNQPPSGDDFWDDKTHMGVPMSDIEAQFDVLLDDHGLSWAGFGTYDDGFPQLELGIFLREGDDVLDDLVALCEDMSAFLADHPDAQGSAGVQVGDDFGNLGAGEPTGVLVVNEEVRPGDPGECAAQ
jgi:hypothetical protein